MTDLTSHQRSILQAVLLGLKVQRDRPADGYGIRRRWITTTPSVIFELLWKKPELLRIAPGQEDKVVRLWGWIEDNRNAFFNNADLPSNDHYIDIGPDGITGGKL